MDAFDLELADAAEQRSDTWRDIRAGKFTASEIYKLMGDPKTKAAKEAGEWADGAVTYIHTKVAEEITGLIAVPSAAYPLVWGEEQEPFAKEAFTLQTGKEVRKAGFIPFTDHAGGSPDGFVDADDAIIEFKCPYNSANQIEYLCIKVPAQIRTDWPQYWWQCQANMLFTKKELCYFVTFDPRFNDDRLRLKIVVMRADPDDQAKILERIEKAIKTKLELIAKLKP